MSIITTYEDFRLCTTTVLGQTYYKIIGKTSDLGWIDVTVFTSPPEVINGTYIAKNKVHMVRRFKCAKAMLDMEWVCYEDSEGGDITSDNYLF